MAAAVQSLQESIALEGFYARLAGAGRGLLMLDYDGTLAPFHTDPADARPYPGVVEALDRIVAAGRTHVAIVTGRSLSQGLPLPPLAAPIDVWGAHGHERRRRDGRCETRPLPGDVIDALVVADDWIEEVASAGARCERKPASVAFHWRGLSPDVAASVRELVRLRWNQSGLGRVLRWLDFDGGVEVAAPNGTKGQVVDVLLAEHPRAPAAYLGDDVTDEDAFLSIRPAGVGVLVRPDLRATAADFWALPPGGVLEILARWHAALSAAR